MKSPKKWHLEITGQKVAAKLRENNFEAEYIDSKEEALRKTFELIGRSKTIGIAGSMTIRDLGIPQKLKDDGKEILDATIPGYSPEENIKIRQRQFSCDCFLCSSNAITMDGKLVNTDSTGNRVGAMAFGPKKVVIVAGANKIVKDVEAAMNRIELYVAPTNNKRMNRPNPCTKTGICEDCSTETRLCNVTTIIKKKPPRSNIHILIVGEELGY